MVSIRKREDPGIENECFCKGVSVGREYYMPEMDYSPDFQDLG